MSSFHYGTYKPRVGVPLRYVIPPTPEPPEMTDDPLIGAQQGRPAKYARDVAPAQDRGGFWTGFFTCMLLVAIGAASAAFWMVSR